MKIRAAVICTALFFSLSFAQYSNGSSSVYGILSFPAGEFADSGNFNTNGNAGIGPGIGLQYIVDPGIPYLDFVGDVSISYQYFDHEEPIEEVGFSLDFSGGNYVCLPLLLSPRVKFDADQMLIFGNLMGGFNVLWQTNMEGSTQIGGIESTVELEFDDPAISFAWGIGAGFVVDQRFTFGFRYLNLGTVDYDYNYSFVTGTREFNFSLMQITAGIQF